MQKKNMKKKRPIDKTMKDNSGKRRPTIGLLINNIIRTWEMLQWWGVSDAARERDVNLLCFPGRDIYEPFQFEAQANIIYDLVDNQRLEGLLLETTGIANYINHEQLVNFYSRYRPLPMVSIEDAIEGIPSVIMDNYATMRKVIEHLIVEHCCRRIAYVTMPFFDRFGFKERFRAYTETLTDYGIPFDPKLVSPSYLDASFEGWLQTRHENKWDAIIGTNDLAIIDTMKKLQSEGVKVPNDLAIAGFDDMEEGQVLTPPLTTVRPPFYEMGYKAVDVLLQIMEGQNVPKQILITSNLIVRESCGCINQIVAHAVIGPATGRKEFFESVFTAREEQILNALEEKNRQFFGNIAGSDDWVKNLWAGFRKDLQTEPSGAFLTALDTVLRQCAVGDKLHLWQEIISVLRREILPCLDGEALQRAEDICQQARTMIGETALRVQAFHYFQVKNQISVLRTTEAALITTFNVDELMDILAGELPRQGITSCYLALYEQPPSSYRFPVPVSEWSNLYLAYDKHGRITLDSDKCKFRSRRLLPDRLWPYDRHFNFVIEPLFFREHQLGFILFEARPGDGQVYEALRQMISSPLEGAYLVGEVKKHSSQLQTNINDLQKAYRELDEARQKIEESNSFIESVIGSMSDAFAVIDTQGRIIKVNEAFINLFIGDDAPDSGKGIINSNLDHFLPVQSIFGGQFLQEFILHTPISNSEISTWPNGRKIPPLSLSAAPVFDTKSGIAGTVIILRDISLQKETENKLTYLASHDSLTGLPNRTILHDRIAQAISKANRSHTQVAVFLLDLDHFKEINDTLGHHTGDHLLKEAAYRLKNCLRQYDTLARMGGDEFVLVFTEIVVADEITEIADRVLKSFESPIAMSGHELHITTSIGISLYPDDGDNMETLLKKADLAMYCSKKLNGNIFCFYNPTMGKSSEDLLTIKNSLINALEKNEFILHYQPLVAADNGKIVAAEALIRWLHPELGLLDPLSFITVAESTGLIVSLGEWILRTACIQCRSWQQAGHNNLPVSVNISVYQLYDEHLTDKILAILQETELSAESLILEITENSAIQNIENTIQIIKRLRQYGVRIFLDDFGSGYSTFNWLKVLPVQAIKIDRHFIQNIINNPFDAAIVKAIVSMAHSLNIKVIAEGVEYSEQLDFLKSLHHSVNDNLICDEFQGYLFSKPISVNEFIQLLLSQQ